MNKPRALPTTIRLPAKMKSNQSVVNPENPHQKVTLIGFTGVKGYRYHPTKGLRKEAGYLPKEHQVIKS